jgi:hypothetical protein
MLVNSVLLMAVTAPVRKFFPVIVTGVVAPLGSIFGVTEVTVTVGMALIMTSGWPFEIKGSEPLNASLST